MTSNAKVLMWQIRQTTAYIADDPTSVALVPSARVATSSGGFTETDGAPRAPQDVKLIELAFDQRPTTTLAGVERLIDYHLVGLPDMAIAVGDYWIDEDGCRWDVVGFSEGWEWETKAFVSRHVPRDSRP